MSARRTVVPCLRRGRNRAAAFLALAALWPALASHAADAAIRPSLSARAFEPGEIVRVEVGTAASVAALKGRFLGAELAFVPGPPPEDGRKSWSAWAVIPLDAQGGTGTYRLTAKQADGSTIAFDGDVAIAAKAFPEQRLTVESKYVNPSKSAAARADRERQKLGAIYARRTPLPPPAAPFVRPVPGEPTSEFGLKRIFNGEPRSPHPGLDLRAPSGTPVLCAGPGTVALAADLYYSGNTVVVDHGGGLFTVYAHLSVLEAKEGARVEAGETIGLSGATGRVTGPHLHWGARVGDAIFDPRGLLDPRLFGRSALE